MQSNLTKIVKARAVKIRSQLVQVRKKGENQLN